mgnify:CR=1 FL=1
MTSTQTRCLDATARTMQPVITKLKAWGARKIVVCTVLASQTGLQTLADTCSGGVSDSSAGVERRRKGTQT